MRTTFEIFEAVQAHEPTTHEECRYALLVFQALDYFARRDLKRALSGKRSLLTPEQQLEEEFQRHKVALSKSPKDYLGWNNDPENPEYRERIRLGRKLVDHLAAKMEAQVKP